MDQPSKMQVIVDRAIAANLGGNAHEAINELIEAIKLLSKAQQQTMGDIQNINHSRTDIPIGST